MRALVQHRFARGSRKNGSYVGVLPVIRAIVRRWRRTDFQGRGALMLEHQWQQYEKQDAQNPCANDPTNIVSEVHNR